LGGAKNGLDLAIRKKGRVTKEKKEDVRGGIWEGMGEKKSFPHRRSRVKIEYFKNTEGGDEPERQSRRTFREKKGRKK